MIQSQVNILNEDRQFNYHVEYVDDIQNTSGLYSYGIISYGEGLVMPYTQIITDRPDYLLDASGYGMMFYRDGDQNIYKNINDWNSWDLSTKGTEKMPIFINESSINIYFPEWSVETYDNGGLYNISIYTYINGFKICLGSYLISRKDALAVPSDKKFKTIEYHEYINVKFIDPWYLCYSDDWADWREDVCGEVSGTNNDGSIITVELTPVELIDGQYRLKSPYQSGVTCMNLGTDREDHLYTKLQVVNTYHTEPYVSVSLEFNSEYNQDLVTYMQETYNLDITGHPCYIDLYIKDENDLYKAIHKKMSVDTDGKIQTSCTFSKSEIGITGWDDYVDGANMYAMYIVFEDQTEDEDIFSSVSEPIQMIPELFKYFIPTDISYINLEHVNMHNYQVDVVNKINKTIISVNKPDDYKANILKPIFIQTQTLGNIRIHPQVTENVCINLNAYKSKVDMFYLRIEGVDFVEVGRSSTGVIFTITGSYLPNETTEGIYYVLDSDKSLITTGNYTYIQ